jgi:hypothetical protein
MVAGSSNPLTITAIDGTGNISLSYSGDKILVFSGANPIGIYEPTVSNKDTTDKVFGEDTVITFTNGISSVGGTMKLYKQETAYIVATDNISTTLVPLEVVVYPAAPSYTVFVTQPTSTLTHETINAIQISLYDRYDNFCDNDNTTWAVMTIGINPSGGTLLGTLSKLAVSGVITFDDLSIDKPGIGYTLKAGSAGLADIESNRFNIIPRPGELYEPAPETWQPGEPPESPQPHITGDSISMGSGADLVFYDRWASFYYEEGEKLKKRYPKGRYRMTVILYEGRVLVSPYDEQGIKEGQGILLNAGESITQIGEVK